MTTATAKNLPSEVLELEKPVRLDIGRSIYLKENKQRIIAHTALYLTTLIRTTPESLLEIHYEVSEDNGSYYLAAIASVPVLSSSKNYPGLVAKLGEKA